MKIVYVCVGNPFTEGMYYKENYFIDANREDGHDVSVIADTTKWEGNKICDVSEGVYRGKNGEKIMRFKLKNFLTPVLTEKLRVVKKMTEILCSEKPDIIFFNNIFVEEVRNIGLLKELMPNVKIYGDVSTSYENSARNFLSKRILHGIVYKKWIKQSMPFWDKIFYVNESSKKFLREMYDVPDSLMELNALPAVILEREIKEKNRVTFRKRFNISDDTVILAHSGKMDARKQTIELMEMVSNLQNKYNIVLFIAGVFSKEIENQAQSIINNCGNIHYLGFLNQKEMTEFLSASDIYIQPKLATQTVQAAISCGTPVVVSDRGAYGLFVERNGFLIDDLFEVEGIIDEVCKNPGKLGEMSEKSYDVAYRFFDYKKLASRLYG